MIGFAVSARYLVYHLTEQRNKESVLDIPNIKETKRKHYLIVTRLNKQTGYSSATLTRK
jgi:hypothetical protein